MDQNTNTAPQTGAEQATEPNIPTPAKAETTPEPKPEPKSEPVKAADTPTAEELAEFSKWQETQKTDAEKNAAAIGKAEKARDAAEARAAAAELKYTALSKGVTAEALDDVIALAKTKISDKVSAEQAIEDIVKKYPAFKGSTGTTGIDTLNNSPIMDTDDAKIRRVMGLPEKK